MARVYGPMFSLTATGSIKGAITYQERPTCNCAMKYVVRKKRLNEQQRNLRYFGEIIRNLKGWI